MKRLAICLIACLLLASMICRAEAPASELDWFSREAGEKATVPEGLTEAEAEIYRLGFTAGHYAALHPVHMDDMYVLNNRTRKFHYSDCLNTLLIDTPNREHSDKSRDELIAEGYSPCGSCKP